MTKVWDHSGHIPLSFEWDAADERYIVGSHQDVAPILEDAHARQTDGTGGYNRDRTIRHAATIPLALYDEWLRQAQKQGIPIYDKRTKDAWLRRKLADHQKLTIKAVSNVAGGFGRAAAAARMKTDG